MVLGFPGASGYLADVRGPRFTLEPPSHLVFSNSSGGRLDCAAEGSPDPRVEWILGSDGSPVVPVPGARVVMANGSLVFPPFREDHFRPDVHSATYRCAASNSAGRVLSLDVQVRAGKATEGFLWVRILHISHEFLRPALLNVSVTMGSLQSHPNSVDSSSHLSLLVEPEGTNYSNISTSNYYGK